MNLSTKLTRIAIAILFFAALLPQLAFADTVFTFGTNLFANGTFESGSTGWSAQPAAGNSTSFTYPVAGNNGSKALGITVTKYKSGDVFWQPANIPVTAGKQYLFSAYSLNSAPVPVIAAFLNSAGKATSFVTLGTVPAGTAWQQFVATTTVPAGAVAVRIQHVMHSTGTLAVDDYSLELISTTTGSGTPPPPPPPPPAVPVISSFVATPSGITAGQSSTLSWGTTGATLLTINQNVGTVTGTSKVVSPTATTTYTLNAGNSSGTTTATVTVNVAPVVVTPPPPPVVTKPTITSFTATPSKITAGQSSTLSWGTTGATLITIDNGVGAVTGISKSVTPTATTTYTISAGNSAGTTTATVVVNVAPVVITPPPPPPPSTNLIPNGNLEAGATNAPTGWNADFWGSLTSKFTYPVAGNGTGKAAEVQITKYKTGDAKWDFDHINVSPNTIYTYTEDYESNVGTSVTIEYTLIDGTFDYEWVKDVATSTTWSTVTIPIFVPSNAVSFTVLHTLNTVGTLTIDNASLVAQPANAFTSGMVTFAFDDGLLSQFKNAAPILTAAGMKAGFYIITTEPASGDSGYMTWAQIKSLNTQGFEIGGHTRTHPFLTTLTPAQLTSEVTGSFTDLVAQGITPKTFVYPFGDLNASVEAAVKTAGYQAARGSYYGENSNTADRYDLEDIRLDNTSTLAGVEAQITQAVADKRWVVFEIHDVLATGGDEYTITPALFQSIVSFTKTSGAQVATIQQGMAQLSN